MKSRYDNNPGKDAKMANIRQKRLQEMHDSSNAFVKSEQAKVKAKGGKEPILREEYSQFDAAMINNGEHAQEFARSLTKGLDKEAFPVK